MFARAASVVALAIAALPFAVGCAGSDAASDTDSDEAVETTSQAMTVTMPDFHKVVDGQLDKNGKASFVLDRSAKFPIIFTVDGSAVANLANGFELKGEATLTTPVGSLTLATADIQLTRSANGGIDTLSGQVSLVVPDLGSLQGLSASAPLSATIGYMKGSDIGNDEAPILADRKYIVLDYSAGLSAKAGPVSMSLGGGKSGTLIVDPMDPSFFSTGDILGLDKVGPFEDVAFGLSARGLLQFTPSTTWGIPEAKSFGGHVYAKGSVKLKRIPLSFDGEAVVNVDPNGKGRTIGSGTPDGVQLGINGQMNLDMDVKAFNFSLPLAKATAYAKITDDHNSQAWISGEIGPDTKWMPSVLPLIPSAKTRVAAYVDADISKSHFSAATDIKLAANQFYTLVPQAAALNLKDIQLAESTLTADSTGVTVTGVVQAPPISFLHASAQLAGVAVFPAQHPEQSSVRLSGDVKLGDLPLTGASATIDQHGFVVNGSFVTPVSTMAMSGGINAAGATLSGSLSVELKGAGTVVQDVACGVEMVTDAGKCGTSYVQSGAECGFSYVESGAQCGYDTVKNCFLSGFSDCHSAKSCNIANSCNVPNSCYIPKTCQQAVPNANIDFGTLQGNVVVTVKGDKATASASGVIILKTGAVMPIGSASVTLGAKPQVCVAGIPGATGTICASF